MVLFIAEINKSEEILLIFALSSSISSYETMFRKTRNKNIVCCILGFSYVIFLFSCIVTVLYTLYILIFVIPEVVNNFTARRYTLW